MPPDANHDSDPLAVVVVPGGTGHADFRFWYVIY
jgi:hypothetical protein